MARFLIELPHEPERLECARVVKVFLTSGSHLLTHADWGCMDGDHRAWIIVDVANRQEALSIVPPAFRESAKVVGLNTFSLEMIDKVLESHPSAS